MRNPDIKVVKLEGDSLPYSVRLAGHSVCYVVMHGFDLRSDFLYTAEEAEAVADTVQQEIFGELRSMLGSVRGK
ncbi:hypothetical protein IPC1521_15315 [Pseudomonas aeruginosa]|nr:hypothetical protein AO932_02415 [Pseudomonas aeruginosa]OFM14393.1 hypothetical protein HMPREF2716_25425 [Pseudomonas sp. HMSC076A11]OFS89127.1 hypothetical protein HMPREF3141_19730 [Pseudomonas sp. HMSC16B01]KSG17545.1 hypothetical protein AO948_24270 [Pseudomonas aeruginosa]KSJ03731.1 hypothetical protein AO998_15685 [Pseudomonas aeruginosa]